MTTETTLAWSTLRKRLGPMMPPRDELDSLYDAMFDEEILCLGTPDEAASYADRMTRHYCTAYLRDLEGEEQ